MKTFVFRNHTVEPFLGNDDIAYSGYGDISLVPDSAERYIWFYQVPINADAAQLQQEVDDFSNRLDLVYSQIGDRKPFIIFSLENLYNMRLSGDDTALRLSIDAFNAHACALAREHANVKWVDLSEFTSRYDAETLLNWKYYFMSLTLLNPRLARDFQQWWQRIDDELASRRKKCLVLDLDNTLWGGVLGDDGIDSIKLGGDYPGNAFHMWQQALARLADAGVILAVCSKNDEALVQQAWDNHPSMVLKRNNFSSLRINWNDKATNVAQIAAELNIGLDSMVFVDDNPAERELIRQQLPQVEVPEFPAQPYRLMAFFKQLVERYFRIYTVTDEDKNKTQQYLANARRNDMKLQMPTMDAYLRSLQMQLTVTVANSHHLPRIAQMTQKTNQFNLTTRRRDEAAVTALLDQHWLIYSLGVQDKFGDSGITGTIFVSPGNEEGTVTIDTLLLSCRILGRGIEQAFLYTVLNDLRQRGVRRVLAEYIPTARNSQVQDFYDRMGMHCTTRRDDGSKLYELTLDHQLAVQDYYSITIVRS